MCNVNFENHESMGHELTWSSPNGFDKIAECSHCGARYLINLAIGETPHFIGHVPSPLYSFVVAKAVANESAQRTGRTHYVSAWDLGRFRVTDNPLALAVKFTAESVESDSARIARRLAGK